MSILKKLEISILILIVIVVAATIATILINNKKSETEPTAESSSIAEIINNTEATKMEKIKVAINGENFEINLEDNSTVSALLEKFPLSIIMSDLNGNEKYFYFDESFPTNAYSPKHIEAGDVMLYGDNCLVIFYKSFDTSYNYTKIGHIDNLPNLGDGNINVSLML